MKIKNIFKSFVAGAAMLAIAGTASATTYDINIYGASAQFTFWNSVASDWIKSRPGCSTDTPTQYTFDGNNKITTVTCTGGNTYNLRVSSKASFDGILSLKGDATYATTGTTAEACSTGDPNYPGDTLAPFYRKMVDESTCSGTTCTGLKCVRVTVGASDVAGASFHQTSTGNQHGSTGSMITRSFTGISTTGLTSAKPFIVPFAFFANTQNATLTTALNGNITRLMAVLLFSGHVDNWNELGSSYPDQHVTLCLRHSGSGTHATLDYAVVRGGNGAWGGSVSQLQNISGQTADGTLQDYDSSQPDIYFNDTTGDELGCINTHQGAIGYADADKAVSATNHTLSSYANVVELAYQGEYATADSVKYSRYDFWTNEWAYYNKTVTDAAGLTTEVANLLTYVAGHIPTAEVPFWVDSNGLKFKKSSDQNYPI